MNRVEAYLWEVISMQVWADIGWKIFGREQK